jgi:hypothetical protein
LKLSKGIENGLNKFQFETIKGIENGLNKFQFETIQGIENGLNKFQVQNLEEDCVVVAGLENVKEFEGRLKRSWAMATL